MDHSPPIEHSVPVAYAEPLLQLVRRWNVSAEELLGHLGLTEADVQDPRRRLALPVFSDLLERARTLTGEPGLGFYLGLQKRVSMYGYLGFAAMSAATLREAIEMFIRFTPTLTTSVGLSLHVDGGMASLTFVENADLGPSRDVGLLSVLVGMRQIASSLTGRELEGESADLALPELPYFHRFRHLLPRTRFNQPTTRVLFEAAYLDLPLTQADRPAERLAREQCERALEALPFDGNIVERARRAIGTPDTEGFCSLEEVAGVLRLSPRTLKRKLAARGTSFSSLLDAERRDRALVMLQSHSASLQDVADRLGYSTLSHFVRAFRRWTGVTPAVYRRRSASPLPSRPQLRVVRVRPLTGT